MNKKLKLGLSLFILGCCWSLVYLIPFIQYVFYEPFKKMLGCTNSQLGFLMTTYGLGNLYGCPLGGYIADKFNYKIIYVCSVILNGILGLIFILNPNYNFAIILWIGFSVASLIMNYPAHIKIIRGLVEDKDQGKIFGVNETVIGIGNIVFNAIMMFLFNRFLGGTNGLKAAISAISVFSIVFGILSWFIIDDPYKKRGEEKISKDHIKMTRCDYLNIIKSPATWLIGLSIFAMYSALTTLSYFTPYFTDVLGVTVTFSGAVAIIRIYGMTLLGAPLGGFLTDKIKSPSKVLLGVNLMAIICLTILMNLDSSVSVTKLTIITLAMSLAIYVGRGSYYAVITELKVPERYTASTIGIAAALGFSPDLFQFILFGQWLDNYKVNGYNYMFIYQLVILAVGVLTAIIVLKIKEKESEL